ncbi:MAG: ABC transporter substrate-binding protein [Sphingomonadaceae bacterium]|nr:ABC transporter substrate-binding protein [Sphingomonadaceae bacterium]
MRAFAFALGISLALAGGGAGATPRRVASLNLCADELVLLIAAPEQIVSVTHLARDPDEFPFWTLARRYPANDGSIVSVAGMRPDLIVTMGGLGRDRDWLARRIGAGLVDLPFPQSIADVEASIERLGGVLGREARAAALIRAIRRARRDVPTRAVETAYLSGGGLSLSASGLGAEWMALAGLIQAALPGDRVTSERLLSDPPAVVLRSNYRGNQASRASRWPGFGLLGRLPHLRTIDTDGRRWTCMGPSLLPEIARLRREVAR